MLEHAVPARSFEEPSAKDVAISAGLWAAGLGWLINDARYNYDTPLVLVAVLMLAAIARVLYAAVSMVEKRVLAWRR